MSSTNKTAELQLSQFIGTDIPSILTDYNGDMQKIDAGVREVKQATAGAIGDLSSVTARVTNAEQDISGLNTTVQGITTRIVSAESNIDTLTSDVTAQGTRLTNAENNIADINSRFDKIQLTGSTHGEVFADALAKAQALIDGGMTSIEVQNQYYVVVNETEFHFGTIGNKELRSDVYVSDVAVNNTTELYGWFVQPAVGTQEITVTRTALEFSSNGVTRTATDKTSLPVSYAYLIRRVGA